jgi:hypothetical protein
MDRISWPCGRSISPSSGVGSRKCIHRLTPPLSAGMVVRRADVPDEIRRRACNLTFRQVAINQCAPNWTKTVPASRLPHNV